MKYTTEEKRELNRKLIKVGDKAIIELDPRDPEYDKLNGMEVEICGTVNTFGFGFLFGDGEKLRSFGACCFKVPEVQQKGCPFDEPL